MSDEIETDAVEVESPSTPESEDVPESPSGDDSGAKADGTESPSAKAAEAEAEPEEWKNLLGKYNGDKEKAGKAYWRAVNDNASLAKENKELKAYREAVEKAKTQKPEEPDPTLKQLDEYITALTNEIQKTLPNKEAGLFKEYQGLEKDVIRLEYQLEQADNVDDKRSLNAELRAARTDLKLKGREIAEVQQKAKWNEAEIERGKNYRKRLEAQHEEDRANKEREAENVAAFNREFPDEINGYIARHAKELGFPTDDKESMDELSDSVYEYLIGFAAKFRGTDEPADIDWSAKVLEKVKREAAKSDRYGRAHFQKVSKEAKDPKPKPSAPKPAPTKSVSPQINDDELTPAMRAARNRLESIGF